MEAYEIDITDWYRILVGQVPLSFFIEALIRALFLYMLLLVCIRLLGKRMAAQLSRNELISLTTLAAAVGVPLQAPDRGLLPPVIISAIVVGGGWLISRWATNNQRVETIALDKLSILVDDGMLVPSNMRNTKITRERLFTFLRSQGITHLGHVRRVYLEAGGFFSIVKKETPSPGLCIIPGFDSEFRKQFRFSQDVCVCQNCGKRYRHDRPDACGNCGGEQWDWGMEEKSKANQNEQV